MQSDEGQDFDDMKACVNMGGWLTRCQGGRWVVVGWVCPHCESDDPEVVCKKPMAIVQNATKHLR